MTRVLFVALLGVSVLLSLVFIGALGDPRRHADRSVAWFLASTGWAALVVDASLLAAAAGAVVPMWVFAAALIAQDMVFGWRLWLVLRFRRRQRHGLADHLFTEE